MKYYLFLDECGDQNLSHFDASFPVFTLCGIIMRQSDYELMEHRIIEMKRKYWKDKKSFFIHATFGSAKRDSKFCLTLILKNLFTGILIP